MAISEYHVAINLSGFTGAAPADGGVDPESVESYLNNLLAFGTAFGSIVIGQTLMVNNIPVTVSSGTTATTLAADINALSSVHHAVAGVSGGNLTLQNEPLYTNVPVSVCDGTPGITAVIGFAPPTLTPLAAPTTLVQALAKKRANLRWNMIMARLGQTMTVNKVHNVVVTGQTLFSVSPTAISFNIVLDSDNPYAYDATSNLLYGAAAVKSAVATALTDDDILTVDVNDPTLAVPAPHLPMGMSALSVEVGALTTVLATALAAVTVTFVV